MRLGGEYRDPSRDYPQWHLRKIFLERIERLAPEVLHALRTDVFPLYQQAIAADRYEKKPSAVGPFGDAHLRRQAGPDWLGGRWTGWDPAEDLEDWSPERHRLREALIEWGERFNLTDDWLLDTALRTLRFWMGRGERPTLEELLPEEVELEALAALRSDVFPVWQDVIEKATGTARSHPAWLDLDWRPLRQRVAEEQGGEEETAALRELCRRLHDWAVALGQASEFIWNEPVGNAALERLRTWSERPRRDRFADPYFMDAAQVELFTFRGWAPQWETWNEWKAGLERHAEEYRRAIESQAREAGLIPSPEKRARRSDDPFQHLDWLVRYQVQEWTHERIANEYDRAYDGAVMRSNTVYKAIRRAATLIGLTRRSSL